MLLAPFFPTPVPSLGQQLGKNKSFGVSLDFESWITMNTEQIT